MTRLAAQLQADGFEVRSVGPRSLEFSTPTRRPGMPAGDWFRVRRGRAGRLAIHPPGLPRWRASLRESLTDAQRGRAATEAVVRAARRAIAN